MEIFEKFKKIVKNPKITKKPKIILGNLAIPPQLQPLIKSLLNLQFYGFFLFIITSKTSDFTHISNPPSPLSDKIKNSIKIKQKFSQFFSFVLNLAAKMKLQILAIFLIFKTVNSQIVCDPELPSWNPHPSSCTHYILCFWGNQIVRPCAPTLHYNRVTTQCMQPELAGCNLDGIPYCSIPDDPNEVIFHPNEDDCTKYFVCHNGNAIARECASGLFWDVNDEWCTFPHLVSCHPNATVTPPPVTTTTTSTTTTTRPTTTTTQTTTTTFNPDFFDCPNVPGTFYHAHTVDCSRYFRCTNGEWFSDREI